AQAHRTQGAAVGVSVGEWFGRLAGFARAAARGRVGCDVGPHDRAMPVEAGMVQRPRAPATVVATAAETHDPVLARAIHGTNLAGRTTRRPSPRRARLGPAVTTL